MGISGTRTSAKAVPSSHVQIPNSELLNFLTRKAAVTWCPIIALVPYCISLNPLHFSINIRCKSMASCCDCQAVVGTIIHGLEFFMPNKMNTNNRIMPQIIASRIASGEYDTSIYDGGSALSSVSTTFLHEKERLRD